MGTIKMSQDINHDRRRFLGTAAMTVAAAIDSSVDHRGPADTRAEKDTQHIGAIHSRAELVLRVNGQLNVVPHHAFQMHGVLQRPAHLEAFQEQNIRRNLDNPFFEINPARNSRTRAD